MDRQKGSAQKQTPAVAATMKTDVENRRAHLVLVQDRTAQAEKTKENKYKNERRSWSHGHRHEVQRAGLDALLQRLAGYKRAITKAAGRDGGRPLQEWRKLLSFALARCTAATILSATGHKALRGA